jgi:hypothetical protein
MVRGRTLRLCGDGVLDGRECKCRVDRETMICTIGKSHASTREIAKLGTARERMRSY